MGYVNDLRWEKYEQVGELAKAATLLLSEINTNCEELIKDTSFSYSEKEFMCQLYYAVAYKRPFISKYPEMLPEIMEQLKDTRNTFMKMMN